jgi:hypothetical protein
MSGKPIEMDEELEQIIKRSYEDMRRRIYSLIARRKKHWEKNRKPGRPVGRPRKNEGTAPSKPNNESSEPK